MKLPRLSRKGRGESARTPAEPVPIVLSLFAWSRRLIAAFLAVAVFALGWSFSSLERTRPDISIRAEPPWQTVVIAICVIVVVVTLAMRRLARNIDRQMRQFGALDALTGLSNRIGLIERLARPRIAVLYLDLDRFKTINDSFGHDTGDEVIRAVAQRIRRVMRPSDLAARLGGDEFAVVIEDNDPEATAREIAGRIKVSLSLPVKADRRELFLTSSIGVAVKSAQLSTPGELLRAADLALYRAKRQGRDRIVFFSESPESNVLHRLDLEKDLWKAMDRGELELDYLPEVSLQSGAVVGLEALVRWRHPDHGLLRPGSFLGLAEETGSIAEVGLWALESACRDWKRWQRKAPARRLNLGVNFSNRQLGQPDLPRRLDEILLATEMDPGSLSIEVSEQVLIDGGLAQMSRLQQLLAMGVRLVIDDFGNGHAPLSYLRQWPVHAIKIDRNLIANLEFDDSKLLILQAIISLAHDLGFEVTGAGIESAHQLRQLHQLGCDHGQGYYLSEPVGAARVEQLLAKGARKRQGKPRLRAA